MSAAREGPQLPPPPPPPPPLPPHPAVCCICPALALPLSLAACCRFNKHEDDFESKQEFDDYLEEREDISESLAGCVASCGWCGAGRACQAMMPCPLVACSGKAQRPAVPCLLISSLQPGRGALPWLSWALSHTLPCPSQFVAEMCTLSHTLPCPRSLQPERGG